MGRKSKSEMGRCRLAKIFSAWSRLKIDENIEPVESNTTPKLPSLPLPSRIADTMLPSGISAAVSMTDGLPVQLIEEGVKEYPKPDGVKFTYGTAGVRTKGHILESVCYRIALISALRSKRLGGKTVGLMVTASHNPEEVS